MSAVLDSNSLFRARCEEIGMSVGSLTSLITAGIDTFAKLAFSSSYQPGSQDDRSLLQVLTDACGGIATSPSDQACLRRAFFEAATMSMAELRTKVDRSEEGVTRKIPQPERASRYAAQCVKLAGMVLTGELECAHSLLDDVSQQREDGVLKYLSPSQCPKREQELCGLKRTSGPLPKDIPATADVSTELRMRSALLRRSLAYDQAGLIDYAVSVSWLDYIFAQMMRLPPDSNFQAVSMAQILQADKQLFIVVAGLSRNGIAPTSAGVRPLDAMVAAARADPQVAALLQPLPCGSANKRQKLQTGSVPHPPQPFAGVERSKGSGKGNTGRGKSAGKGKGARKGTMPEALRGMHFKTPSGESICYGYNLPGGCDREACRNKHVCCMPGCYALHPVSEHPRN